MCPAVFPTFCLQQDRIKSFKPLLWKPWTSLDVPLRPRASAVSTQDKEKTLSRRTSLLTSLGANRTLWRRPLWPSDRRILLTLSTRCQVAMSFQTSMMHLEREMPFSNLSSTSTLREETTGSSWVPPWRRLRRRPLKDRSCILRADRSQWSQHRKSRTFQLIQSQIGLLRLSQKLLLPINHRLRS